MKNSDFDRLRNLSVYMACDVFGDIRNVHGLRLTDSRVFEKVPPEFRFFIPLHRFNQFTVEVKGIEQDFLRTLFIDTALEAIVLNGYTNCTLYGEIVNHETHETYFRKQLYPMQQEAGDCE